MTSPIAKVSLGDLAEFLERHAREWDVDAFPAFEESLPHQRVSVDELITAIECYSSDSEFVYVFSDEMTPYDAVHAVNLDEVPEIATNLLEQYIIRLGKARDFLYVAPSIEDASNGFYANLMPVEEESPESPPTFLISAISIQNFKGIGDRQTIDLKPITLLFGPNSGGKSTVLQAIHYAREILVRRNLDADRTETGGSLVDLGGFECFVHKHDRRRRVGLRFDLDLTDASLPEYAIGQEGLARFGWRREPRRDKDSHEDIPAPHETLDFSEGIKTASVELAISWSDLRQECFVESYCIGINGEHLATIHCDYNRREVGISPLNTKHPIFGPNFPPGEWCRSDEETMADLIVRLALGYEELGTQPIFLDGLVDALPRWGSCLSPNLDHFHGDLTEGAGFPDGPDYWQLVQLIASLSQLVVGPGEILRNELARFRYLGPLRDTPSREHRPPRFPDPSRWANGLAAWDVLYQESDEFVEKASDWLSLKERLDAGYRIQAKRLKELDLSTPLAGMLMSSLPLDSLEDIRDELNRIPIRRRLVLIDEQAAVEVQPQDVGVGISQLIPVVVLALEDRADLGAIEQPELHVHPRIQIGLGDLFIWAITVRPAARFLIETHSEHLLLRLIRRIRETAEGEIQPNQFPSLTPDRIAVYYVENIGGQTVFKPLRLDETGEFIDRWPGGFFEERARELF